MLRTHFFFTFSGKTGQITRYLEKKIYGHQLGPMTHFLTTPKFDLLSYIYIINFLNLPVHALIHDLQKKNLRASTRTHDPFFDNPEIWPTFIYRGEVPAHTFAKLPVRTLINDSKKKLIQKSTTTRAPFFDNPKIWPTFIYLDHQFFKSSCACSNSWPTKKNLWASTRTYDPFFDNPEIWPTFIYRGEVPAHTFANLPVRTLINDSKKKLIQKSTTTRAPFFDNPKIWPTFIYLDHQFFKSSCACSNSWPTKKTYGHQLGPMTHFLTTLKFDLLLYIGEKCLRTHLQSFLCAP